MKGHQSLWDYTIGTLLIPVYIVLKLWWTRKK